MAEDVNLGVAPPDLTSPVGKFRALVNDLIYEEADPPSEGVGNYRYLSDDEITTLLDSADGNVSRAAGLHYLALAGEAAAESKLIQDHDLKISTVSRSNDLRRVGLAFLNQADAEDISEGSQDIFDSFTLGGNSRHIAEGSLPEWGRTYTWDRL